MSIRLEAFLAEDAQVVDGKLDARGIGWTRLLVTGLPAHGKRVAIGLMLQVPAAEVGSTHRLSVRLEGPDGARVALGVLDARPVFELHTEFTPDGPGALSLPSVIAFDDITFAATGRHRFVIAIDGVDARLVGFAVERA